MAEAPQRVVGDQYHWEGKVPLERTAVAQLERLYHFEEYVLRKLDIKARAWYLPPLAVEQAWENAQLRLEGTCMYTLLVQLSFATSIAEVTLVAYRNMYHAQLGILLTRTCTHTHMHAQTCTHMHTHACFRLCTNPFTRARVLSARAPCLHTIRVHVSVFECVCPGGVLFLHRGQAPAHGHQIQ